MFVNLNKNIRLIIVCSWLLAGSSALASPIAAQPTAAAPTPPECDAKAYVLMDANSGYIITGKDIDERLPPASLTKVMTLYLVADALKAQRLHFEDTTIVSEGAWRTGGSRMFIKVGTSVSIKDLISGIATASGNDATVAMAEHIAGTESSFANLMNQAARQIGMQNSSFSDSNGLPSPNHYSSAKDLALLAQAWVKNFPEYYPWFKEKWMSYNGIKQPNRNRLLWRDSSVDGFKTGHTDESGYCLIASAVRNNGMRLISVVLGAANDTLRTKYSEALLNYGFRFFETRKIFAANTKLATPKVWLGKQNTVTLGLSHDMYVTLPIGKHAQLKAKADIIPTIKAPVAKGQVYGNLNISLNDKIIASQPLVALTDVKKANFIFALYDRIIMLFKH